MTEWYYTRNGEQRGPVTFQQLGEIARNGELHATNDLVWANTLPDWISSGDMPGIFGQEPVTLIPRVDRSNPYAPPQSEWVQPTLSADLALKEIVPGCEPFEALACIKRGFELTKRHFGFLMLVGLTYAGVILGMSILLGIVAGVSSALETSGQESRSPLLFSSITQIITRVVSLFLTLGMTRIGLNIVSGKNVSIGMLFGEGRKLLRAIGASILFALMVFAGMLLLIVPGIYLALRYGQFLTAIVDRDLGIMDAFSYSSSITTNNRGNLVLLHLLGALVVLAGIVALLVGVLFALPVVWLGMVVAYRWMQYGHRAAMDHEETATPMLASL